MQTQLEPFSSTGLQVWRPDDGPWYTMQVDIRMYINDYK